MFKYDLEDEVKLQESGEQGQIIARSEHTISENNYHVRYKAADGRQVESWWGEDALINSTPRQDDVGVHTTNEVSWDLSELQPLIDHSATLLRNVEAQLSFLMEVNQDKIIDEALVVTSSNVIALHTLANDILDITGLKVLVAGGPGGDKLTTS